MANKDKRNATTFRKGQGGRPKGARNKFAQAFIKDVADSWKKNGPDVLEKLKKDKPEVYAKIAGGLIPKDIDVQHSGNINVSVVDYKEDE